MVFGYHSWEDVEYHYWGDFLEGVPGRRRLAGELSDGISGENRQRDAGATKIGYLPEARCVTRPGRDFGLRARAESQLIESRAGR
jgi:hypothetical protein